MVCDLKKTIQQKIIEKEDHGIDLAPLLDVVFILLIFFIVTTVFVKESGVEVDKPTAISTQTLNRSIIIIAITANREVMYNSTNIGVAGVRGTISQITKNRMKPVVIQADKRVPTELLVNVLDQVKLAGVKSVNIATQGE